ncbi:hypothetical protein RU94_GL001037 [Enterococcus asini]|nr:hypothetical protein RU94_GL001037 [Enterococcus asini]
MDEFRSGGFSLLEPFCLCQITNDKSEEAVKKSAQKRRQTAPVSLNH